MQQLYLYITIYIVPKLKNHLSENRLSGMKPIEPPSVQSL